MPCHHVGEQIGFGQTRSGVGLRNQSIAAQLLGNGTGDRAHALYPLALRAQLVVVNHFVQTRHAGFEGFLAVLVEEKLGIGQARSHHALIAANHQARVGRLDVAHHEKLVGQLARGIEQGKVFLVGLHREDEAFLRHIEKLFFEFADQDIRALDQRGDFVQQGVVIDRLAAPAHFGGSSSELALDLSTALGKAGDHRTVFEQGLRVAVGVLEDHRGHRRFEAMALCAVARLQTECRDRHHRAAVQGHQPVRRAHKLHTAPAGHVAAVLQLVGHDFGDGQFGQGFAQGFLQAVAQRDARRGAVIKQGFGLAVQGTTQAAHRAGVSAQGLQPLEQGRGGLTGSVQPDAHRHEFLRHRFVRCQREHGADMRGQTAR
jgi:hypothetical protein